VQPVPPSVQFTPLFCPSFETVAVNACVNPACTPALVGAALTEIAGVTVIAAEADFVGSPTGFAVSVTSTGAGAFAGAVYVMAVPDALAVAEIVPHVAPLHPVPPSVQPTPLFCPSFETVAVKL
jgi:hypothetical protein